MLVISVLVVGDAALALSELEKFTRADFVYHPECTHGIKANS